MPHDNIARALADLRNRATARGVRLPKVVVLQGPASDFTDHRAHAYCQRAPATVAARGGFDWGEASRPGALSIVYAPKLAVARMRRILGVLAHEYGHAALLEAGIVDHTERDADKAAEMLFGLHVNYDEARVQTAARTPSVKTSRPKSLPNR